MFIKWPETRFSLKNNIKHLRQIEAYNEFRFSHFTILNIQRLDSIFVSRTVIFTAFFQKNMFSIKIKAKTLRNILLPGKRTFSSQIKHLLRHKEVIGSSDKMYSLRLLCLFVPLCLQQSLNWPVIKTHFLFCLWSSQSICLHKWIKNTYLMQLKMYLVVLDSLNMIDLPVLSLSSSIK